MEQRELFADLHIHSRFSRACSNQINIPNLVKWARVKGLSLLGTGDFQHPEWFKELDVLEEREGILWFSDKESLPTHPKDSEGEFPFVWQTEISLMYTQGKGRRVHLVVLAPSKEIVKQIINYLGKKGRLDYDGRPIFKIPCYEFVEAMKRIDDKIEIIPAHAWTSWFGIFGSNSGFDSLKEAFQNQVDKVYAIETGLSSDPLMNWKIKELNNKSIVSFSDSHSFWPWRLGREATIFEIEEGKRLNYDLIIKQIRENSFIGTVEVSPLYGKYHWDGHRNCGFSCSPEESKKLNGICPKCKNPLTIGVEYRVNELTNQSTEENKNKKYYYTLLPLHEIISLASGVSMNSKGCWQIYNSLIEKFGNEFNVLLRASKVELASVLKNELLVELIMKNRAGNIKIKPGFDGEYGVALLEKSEKQERLF